jgi:hypothetical protein
MILSPRPDSPDTRVLLHEKLDALLDDCEQVMDSAAYGETLDDLDDFLFVEGKKFVREILQQKLQKRVEQEEAKEEIKQCPDCKKNSQPIQKAQNSSFLSRPHHLGLSARLRASQKFRRKSIASKVSAK